MSGFYTITNEHGNFLHVRKFDEAGAIMTTPVTLNSWVAHSEQQAKAQAAFLGPNWRACYVPDAKPPHIIAGQQK